MLQWGRSRRPRRGIAGGDPVPFLPSLGREGASNKGMLVLGEPNRKTEQPF